MKRGYYTRLFYRCKCLFGETPSFLESAHLLEHNFFEIAYYARPHGYGKWLLRETHFRGNNYSARPNWLFGGNLLFAATLGVIWRNTTLRNIVLESGYLVGTHSLENCNWFFRKVFIWWNPISMERYYLEEHHKEVLKWDPIFLISVICRNPIVF